VRKSATRTEELRLTLADEIVQGRLRPGTPLEEVEIARRFGVSRTPVREALRELAASGLVEARPHRSALVALPSLERLRGMFDVMAELEAICAGLAAVHMNSAERQGLQGLHESLADLVRRGDPQRYHEVNERFHGAIYAGSHNEYLAEITFATRARLSPFRRAQFRTLGRLALSHAEHERVVTAILRGDKAAAEAAMRGHITLVEDAYERYTGTR
jgi:DNA-binding GntR family transcriptional regulator